MQPSRRKTRGISLIEAMVAMAVMGFGTLAVLGVQTSLRLNADIAKQRSEAVRIAQERIELARTYSDLETYTALAGVVDDPVAGYATANTTYRVTETVTDAAAADPTHPRRKSLVVDVAWKDRTGQDQSIRLAAAIEGVSPALAASMGVPAELSLGRQPARRHPAIPPTAVDQGDGTSKFELPGGQEAWVFNNVNADITQVCTGEALANCIDVDRRLLAGYVRFATDAAPPTAWHALYPPGTETDVALTVSLTAPTTPAATCFDERRSSRTRAYYCAVPVTEAGVWSGRSLIQGLPLADSAADANGWALRVCRYTPYRDTHPTVPDQMTNEQHPLDYVDVAGPLVNQNFLVIRAGNGSSPYGCPGDVSNDLVNTNTWHHQPAS